MTIEENPNDLERARNLVAKVYEKEATDNHPDNGNLSTMNQAILNINTAMAIISKRLESK